MGITAKFGILEEIINNVTNQFDPKKPCVFWSGISAFNIAEQRKYENKIEKAKQSSKPEKLDQDLEKIILQHEHKQRGKHYAATLHALKSLQRELGEHNYKLKQFVFCETSYLHRHNRLLVDELNGLEIEQAGEKALECFGKPWKKEASAAMSVIFDHSDSYQIDSWKEWVVTERAAKYIQEVRKEYSRNTNFKAVVDQAASDKLMSKNVGEAAFQNSVTYILEEAAKVWGLQEEFAGSNLIVAYPGDLPPAVQYLMGQKDFNFIFFKITFSGTLTAQKRPKLEERAMPLDDNPMESERQAQSKEGITRLNSSLVRPESLKTYSSVKKFLQTIDDLPISIPHKEGLRAYAIGVIINGSSSIKELWDLGRLCLEQISETEVDPTKLQKLREFLMSTFSTSSQTIPSSPEAGSSNTTISEKSSIGTQTPTKKI